MIFHSVLHGFSAIVFTFLAVLNAKKNVLLLYLFIAWNVIGSFDRFCFCFNFVGFSRCCIWTTGWPVEFYVHMHADRFIFFSPLNDSLCRWYFQNRFKFYNYFNQQIIPTYQSSHTLCVITYYFVHFLSFSIEFIRLTTISMWDIHALGMSQSQQSVQ